MAMRQPRWAEVRYGWGFQKFDAAGTDTVSNMMADYEKLVEALENIVASADDAGCYGAYVVDEDAINRAGKLLGWKGYD